jgi:adenylate cyclase
MRTREGQTAHFTSVTDGSEQENAEAGRMRRAGRAVATAAGRVEQSPRLVTLVKLLREYLPGDSEFGDSLSTGGKAQAQVVGRRLSAATAKRPGVLREAGLSALQVWQSLAEAQGRGRGDRELAIVFTDLVDFSDWALDAGDDAAVDLLRDVGEAIEPPVESNGGDVVKRLGDGMMAVFDDSASALEAVLEARRRLREVKADGYRPRLRAGIHVGRPRCIGGDYLGVDVNVAARMAEEAAGDEILVSDRTLAALGEDRVESSRKRRFKVKGVPRDLSAYSVEPA